MSIFRKKQQEGALPLIPWNQGAFPFRGNPGHNYDTWAWPYPAQSNQYTYFNAFYGNQLPNFYVAVPRLEAPQQQIQPSWLTQTNKQQQNALQGGSGGSSALQWGQQGIANYISNLGNLWSGNNANAGGGRMRRR